MALCEITIGEATRCRDLLAGYLYIQCEVNPAHRSREGCCLRHAREVRTLLEAGGADCLACRQRGVTSKMHEIPQAGLIRGAPELIFPGGQPARQLPSAGSLS